jgi:hypothetical protein
MKNITAPRIIGIVMLLMAIFAFWMRLPLQGTIIAIAGLIFLFASKETAKKGFRDFINSFKLKTDYAWIMFIDAITWVICGLLSLALYAFTKSTAEMLSVIQLGDSLNTAMLSTYNDLLSSFFTNMIIALIICYLLCIILYTVSRGFIWLILLEKPMHFGFFLRFGLLNLLWCTVWAIAAGFLIVMMKVPLAAAAVLIIAILLYTHLTTVLHYSYTKNRAFGKAISDAFSTGFGKAASFVQPYCYVLIVYIAVSQLLRIAQGRFLLTATFILFFAFMAWYRIYMRNTLRHIA